MHRPVVAACFQKKHARLAVSGKTIGEDASCRSRTDDHIIPRSQRAALGHVNAVRQLHRAKDDLGREGLAVAAAAGELADGAQGGAATKGEPAQEQALARCDLGDGPGIPPLELARLMTRRACADTEQTLVLVGGQIRSKGQTDTITRCR